MFSYSTQKPGAILLISDGIAKVVICLTDSDVEILVVKAFACGKYLQLKFDEAGKVTSWAGQPTLTDKSVAHGKAR